MKKLLLQLITDKDGRVSHTKFWSNIAYVIASWVIVQLTIKDKLLVDYFLVYLGVVGAHTTASKWISQIGSNKKAE